MENVTQKRMQRLRELDRRKIVVCWTFTATIAAVMLAWGPEALFWNRPPSAFLHGTVLPPVIWLLPPVQGAVQVTLLKRRRASDTLLLAFTVLAVVVGLFAGPFAAWGVIWLFPHRIPKGDRRMRPVFQFVYWLIQRRPGSGSGYIMVLLGLFLCPLPPELVWAILCASTAALLGVWVWSRTRDEAV